MAGTQRVATVGRNLGMRSAVKPRRALLVSLRLRAGSGRNFRQRDLVDQPNGAKTQGYDLHLRPTFGKGIESFMLCVEGFNEACRALWIKPAGGRLQRQLKTLLGITQIRQA